MAYIFIMFSFHDVCTVSTQYIQIVSPPPIPHKLLPTQISLQMIRGVPEQFGDFGEKATLKYSLQESQYVRGTDSLVR